jgi:hypothetical protein
VSTVSGAVYAFYLFDVAQGIDLPAFERLLGPRAASATLTDKSAGPPRVRYFVPPVIADAAALGIADIDGFSVRVKGYDYGVLSLMLSRPFTGDWHAFVALGQDLIESESLERRAAEACAAIVSARGMRSSGSGRHFSARTIWPSSSMAWIGRDRRKASSTNTPPTSRNCCAASARRSAARNGTRSCAIVCRT